MEYSSDIKGTKCFYILSCGWIMKMPCKSGVNKSKKHKYFMAPLETSGISVQD